MTRRYAKLAPTMLAVALVALPILYASYRWSDQPTVPFPVACGQSVALLAVFVALRDRRPSRAAVIGIAASSLTTLAIALAAQTGGDAWAYVGYAILPHFHDAYHPPNVAFHGDFAAANKLFGLPIAPCVYGPLWLFYDRLLLHWVPTMAVGVAVLKVVGAATFLAILAVLRRLAVPFAVLALVALNPAMINDAVQAAHNDFVAALLSLAALLALGGRRTIVAIALLAGAILIKITFAVVALVVLGRAPARLRLVALGATLALAVPVIAVAGGADYLHALTVVGRDTWQNPGRFGPVHVLTGAIAVCLAVVAFTRGRLFPALSWTFVALSTALYSWYLSWALPYVARARGEGGIVVFAAWPLFQAINDGYGRPLSPMILFTLLYAIAAFAVVRTARRAQLAAAPTT